MKRGQLTVFIILAIIAFSLILIFFLWYKPTYIDEGGKRLRLESCVEDVVKTSLNELEKNGEFLTNGFYKKYQGENIPYLCYTSDYYKTCTIQNPFIFKSYEKALNKVTKEKIKSCYDSSIDELRAQGFNVRAGEIKQNITIVPGKVRTLLSVPTRIGSQSFQRFNVEFNSPIYEMLFLATSLIQSEAELGSGDLDSLRSYYPDYRFKKLELGDGTTIYTIKSIKFNDEIKFASRSLVFPPGYS